MCSLLISKRYMLLPRQDEIAESKRKFKITSHQIDQLKEEVSAKDLALVKEHFEHLKVCLMRKPARQVAVTGLWRGQCQR